MNDWTEVTTALLGSWPQQVAGWGREAIAAYLSELEARGLTPDRALTAIRTSDSKFPPSAGELVGLARHDPDQPTWAEAYRAIYGRAGVLKAREPYTGVILDPEESRDRAARARAAELHPLIGKFIEAYGLDRLRMLQVDDPVHGELVRKDLGVQWAQFVDSSHDRDLATFLAGGRLGELAERDPAALPKGNG